MVMKPVASNARDLIENEYGVRTTEVENPLITASGAAATRVFSNNPRRLGIVLINLSANVVYLGLGADVAAAKGIYLAANGGNVSMNIQDDFTLPTREWWVISPAGASNIYSLSEEILGGGQAV
jgi:hypothetical protein